MPVKSAKDLLEKAARDKEFAKQVLSNPTQFKQEYALTDEQLKTISGAADLMTADASYE